MPRTLKVEVPRVFRPLLEPARFKGAYGGRGSGKSHFFAGQVVLRALAGDGLRVVCIREVQRSLRNSSKLLIEDKIKTFGVGGAFRVLEREIETPGAGIIIFEGMQNHTDESIKSLEGFDLAWVEEAQSLSKSSLDKLTPTIRREGSELWFSWNPRKPTDPVDQMFRHGEPHPDAIVVQSNYRDNPFFPDSLRADMERDRKRDPDKYKHVWLGGYQSKSEARVFHNWKVERFDTPEGVRFYLGADWGFSVDPAVLVRCFIKDCTLYVDWEVYKVGCEVDRTPDLFDQLGCPSCLGAPVGAPCEHDEHGMARRWPIIADSARPETISYMQRHGYPRIEPARKGAGSVEEGVEFLKSYDIVVHPRCERTIDELSGYSYKVDRLTDEVLPQLEDKKNHVIDSLRYAVERSRRRSGRIRRVRLG